MSQPAEWHIETAAGLRLLATDNPSSLIFDRFFAGYDKAFVLPNEKEDIEGFRICLKLNHGVDYDRLSAQYGAFREICLVAEDAGIEVGGANFIAMPVSNEVTTANLNYIYVNEGARGCGYLAKLFSGVRELICGLFSGRRDVLIFIEQNDPFRMTEWDYRRDTAFTGLDQFDRLRIWSRLGAKVVDFSYKQPPLSAGQQVDDTLLYSVLGAPSDTVDACILESHLHRFFGISVLKGANLTINLAAREQVDILHADCVAGKRIQLIDPAPLLTRIHSRESVFSLWPRPPEDFRSALRG